jgi:hypothetical protein
MIVAWILAVSHEAASAGLEMSVWADFGLCVSIVIYSLQAREGQHLSRDDHHGHPFGFFRSCRIRFP